MRGDCHYDEQWDMVFEFNNLPKPLLANEANKMHWSGRRNFIEVWKSMGIFNAKSITPKGDYLFKLCCYQTLEKKPGRPRDIDAIVPSLKAYVDGLILGGLAPDDSIKWYHGLCLHPVGVGLTSTIQIDLSVRLVS